MLGKFGFVAILLTYACCIFAQDYNQRNNFFKANDNWVFGINAGLDFSTGTPSIVRTGLSDGWEGVSAVSDSNGRLLFYFSHNTIYNRNHLPMMNGSGLIPDGEGSSSQGAVIIPIIDTPWKYYVFANQVKHKYLERARQPTLTYSVVDMSLDNGLGAVENTRKNIPLYRYALSEAMIAIPGDNCDIWLLAHSTIYIGAMPPNPEIAGADTTSFFLAWRITQDGIDPFPVVSPFNGERPAKLSGLYGFLQGCLAVSPDRQRIALASQTPGDGTTVTNAGVLLAKFDAATGLVSDGIWISEGRSAYGVCFAQDNTKLYTSVWDAPVGIRQYEISNYNQQAINGSEYLASPNSTFGQLKLYRDVIYTSRWEWDFLDWISAPNLSGAACNFQQDAIQLQPGTKTKIGLPSEIVFPLNSRQTTITSATACFTNTIGKDKTLSVPAGFTDYIWDDSSTTNTRSVEGSGTYWVNYNDGKCHFYIDTFHAIDLTFSLGADTTLLFCSGPSSGLELHADVVAGNFRWKDGSMKQDYRATTPGVYWVEVEKGGCTSSDSINIEGVTLNIGTDTICKGDPVNLTLITPPIPTGTIIQWSNGDTSSAINIIEPGSYWVSLFQPPCRLTDTIHIGLEICDCFVQLPSAFSPNTDGANDYFSPLVEKGCTVSGYLFRIYNRLGQLVFQTTNPADKWNGSFKGAPADIGTYFYELSFEGGTKRKTYHRKGDVTLLR